MKAIRMIIVVTLLLGLSAVAYAETPEQQTAELESADVSFETAEENMGEAAQISGDETAADETPEQTTEAQYADISEDIPEETSDETELLPGDESATDETPEQSTAIPSAISGDITPLADEPPFPLYTVTIPKLLVLEPGENELPITVSGIEKGQNVTITFEGTQEPTTGRLPPQFVLRNPDAPSLGYQETFGYELMDENGASLPNNPDSIGATLLVFARDDTESIQIRTADPERSNLLPGSPYTGNIVFGIKLADA